MLLPGVKIEYTITDIKRPVPKSKLNNSSNKKTQLLSKKVVNENLAKISNKAIVSNVNKLSFKEEEKNIPIPNLITNLIPNLPDKTRFSPRCYSPRRKIDPASKVNADGWNISTSVPNRDDLIREQDNKISKLKVKKNNWMEEENIKETNLQIQDQRKIQKEKLRVVDARANRYPSKNFGAYVNNPFKAYPFLHEDPIMVSLNHDKWDGGSDRYSNVQTRSLPEKPQKNHETFVNQFRIKKNEKRVDHIAVTHDISDIEDIKGYY